MSRAGIHSLWVWGCTLKDWKPPNIFADSPDYQVISRNSIQIIQHDVSPTSPSLQSHDFRRASTPIHPTWPYGSASSFTKWPQGPLYEPQRGHQPPAQPGALRAGWWQKEATRQDEHLAEVHLPTLRGQKHRWNSFFFFFYFLEAGVVPVIRLPVNWALVETFKTLKETGRSQEIRNDPKHYALSRAK